MKWEAEWRLYFTFTSGLFHYSRFLPEALAATVEATHAGRLSESSLLLRNVQVELLRLGCDVTLLPLPETTADHIYVDPPWNSDGEDLLMRRLQDRAEWQQDAGFIHRTSHHGSNFGFREKRSPSLHISVYPRGRTYVYEMHYDRFLALGARLSPR